MPRHRRLQHLAQPGRVADQLGGHIRRDLADQPQTLLMGLNRHDLGHLLQQVGQREPGVIGVPSSRLRALARAITSCGSEMSAGVILFITSAAV